MKGVSCVLILLLLVMTLILTAGCVDPGQKPGESSPVNVILANAMIELKTPDMTMCTSPAWRLIHQWVSNPGQKFDPDHCYQYFAVLEGDTAKCYNVERGAPKTKCFVLIAGNKNDPAVCDQIPQTNDMQAYLEVDCLWEVAIKNNNKAACEAMGNQKISRMFVGEMSRQTCLARLASGQGVGGSTL
jgi:hypothetical protein